MTPLSVWYSVAAAPPIITSLNLRLCLCCVGTSQVYPAWPGIDLSFHRERSCCAVGMASARPTGGPMGRLRPEPRQWQSPLFRPRPQVFFLFFFFCSHDYFCFRNAIALIPRSQAVSSFSVRDTTRRLFPEGSPPASAPSPVLSSATATPGRVAKDDLFASTGRIGDPLNGSSYRTGAGHARGGSSEGDHGLSQV